MAGPFLVTGFGPFPGVKVNPTAGLAQAVARRLAGHGLHATALVLPTSYGRGLALLRQALLGLEPVAVLMLGLAARSHWVRIERHGRDDASPLHPDAAGALPPERTASSTLPRRATTALEPALAAMLRQGLRARLSPSAGRYLCNAAYALALRVTAGGGVPVLFVHIPWPRGARGRRPEAQQKAWRPKAAALERALTGAARRMRRVP